MADRITRNSLLDVILAAAACNDPTGPLTTLAIDRPADFTAAVISNIHSEFFAPSGSWIPQSEIWIAIPPSREANAGVVLPSRNPVFQSKSGGFFSARPEDIAPGATIQVWHDFRVAYGSMQAPPGAPAYTGLQIVILRR